VSFREFVSLLGGILTTSDICMIANIPLITRLGYPVQFMNLLIPQYFVNFYYAE
jgi:hypothetical protein